MLDKTIPVTTHGRYLVADARAEIARAILVGFHGYAEPAEAQFDRLRATPGAEAWRIVSVQGLNRFYERRTNKVVAGWMTRQDRELAIADNLRYVEAVIDEVRDGAAESALVFAGFSQGVAMTFRAATASSSPVAGVIAVGGDVPPELGPEKLAKVAHALVCRGTRDEWYTAEKFGDDLERLRGAGVAVTAVEFDGGHEWSAAVTDRVAAFLAEFRR
jgi:predicted esterase